DLVLEDDVDAVGGIALVAGVDPDAARDDGAGHRRPAAAGDRAPRRQREEGDEEEQTEDGEEPEEAVEATGLRPLALRQRLHRPFSWSGSRAGSRAGHGRPAGRRRAHASRLHPFAIAWGLARILQPASSFPSPAEAIGNERRGAHARAALGAGARCGTDRGVERIALRLDGRRAILRSARARPPRWGGGNRGPKFSRPFPPRSPSRPGESAPVERFPA